MAAVLDRPLADFRPAKIAIALRIIAPRMPISRITLLFRKAGLSKNILFRETQTALPISPLIVLRETGCLFRESVHLDLQDKIFFNFPSLFRIVIRTACRSIVIFCERGISWFWTSCFAKQDDPHFRHQIYNQQTTVYARKHSESYFCVCLVDELEAAVLLIVTACAGDVSRREKATSAL